MTAIQLITSRRAASLVRVSVSTMRRWYKEGMIQGCSNEEGQIWIDLREVQRILDPDRHALNQEEDVGRIET